MLNLKKAGSYKIGSWAYSFLLLLMGVMSCKEKPAQHISNTTHTPAIDTINYYHTYTLLKHLDTTTQDTAYIRLLSHLRNNDEHQALLGHSSYYDSLRGANAAIHALISNFRGYAYNYLAIYDSAHFCFEDARKWYEKHTNNAVLADVYLGLGTNYAYQGDYLMSSGYHYKALKIYEQLKDSDNIYRAQGEIAVDLYYQKEYKKAEATLLSCMAYSEKRHDKAMLAYAQSILATLYYNMGNYNKALDVAGSSLQIRRQLKANRDIAESLNNQALSYMALQQWDMAIAALTESLTLMQGAGDVRQIPIIKQNLAHCVWRRGNISLAKSLLHNTVDEATHTGQKDAIANAYHKLANIYKNEKQYDSALVCYKQYKSWSDSLYNYEKEKAISELNIKYETEKKESQITQLQAEKKLIAIKQVTYFILLVSTLMVGGLTVSLLTIRNRRNKLMIEKVQLQLEINKKDLANFTENIFIKNKFIDELEHKLNDLSAARMVVEENNESLSQLYQFKILTEDDWRQFKIHFDKVYPGFITTLREKYPDLAPAEERQFLLIKLNINNKESADMLGISQPSVKKNRYRLKKRFGLTENDDLDAFVRNFA